MKKIKLPKVALGTWSWGSGAAGGDQVFGNNLEEKDLKEVFKKATENGLNLWDTAAVYGMGSSEKILGSFVKNCLDDVIISTKFTPQIADDTNEAVLNMLNGSKKRLNTDYIDIYWIHNPADIEKWTPYFADLVKSGHVGQIGVSNHNLDEIKRVNKILSKDGVKISAVQNHYSLLNRSSERGGILEYCHKNDITFYSYMVLEQGALSGKYDVNHPFPEGSDRANSYNPILGKIDQLLQEMRNIGNSYGISPAQVASIWAISKGTLPIIGVTSVKQVEDIIASTKITLTSEEINKLDTLADTIEVSTIREWEKRMD